MPDINWLAQGTYPLFALIIGFIVSIDVFVVEFTRDYKGGLGKFGLPWTGRMWLMAFLHAFFHSASFVLYLMAIYFAEYLAILPIDLFDLPEGTSAGLLTLVHFIVVCFIWWTYRSKIREDHSEKSDSDKVDRGDMQFFVNFVTAFAQKIDFGYLLRGGVVAASVAVDMLAMSALLKLYLLPIEGKAPVAQHTGNLYIDIPIFAAIIFVVVLVLVLVAQMANRAFARSIPFIVVLRLAEPLIVFFIVAGTVRYFVEFVLRGEIVAVEFGYREGFVDLAFAIVIVISLIWSNGLKFTGKDGLFDIWSRRSIDDPESEVPNHAFGKLFVGLNRLLPAFWAVFGATWCVIGSMAIAYSTGKGNTHNHLIEATGYFAGFALLATIIVLYTPSRWLDSHEAKQTGRFDSIVAATPLMFWSRLGGIFLALIALNAYNFIVFGGYEFAISAEFIASGTMPLEVGGIGLWSAYLVLTWFLFDLRRWRFYRVDTYAQTSATSEGIKAGRINDSDFAELVSAGGIASALVALFAKHVVSSLI